MVEESLRALGATAVFGLPGIHALPIWEALRESSLRTYGFRTELNAGFAAAGWAHVTGRVAPLVVSTGPGALNSLTALMEAATAHLPVLAISSQIPSGLIGRGRGYLHELPDQSASFAPIVKWTGRAHGAAEIPDLVAQAWRAALTPPSGPVYVEIPQDVLKSPATAEVAGLDGAPGAPVVAAADAIQEAARLLSLLLDPVIWAGGGVLRSGAWRELKQLAEKLHAPVASTYMGKGAFPEDHPLSVGSYCDHPAFRELLSTAGVVLCVGTELGSETTGDYSLKFSGRLIQVDADARRIGATYPALSLVGDAGATLRELIPRVAARPAGDSASRAGKVRAQVDRDDLEMHLLRTIRSLVPRDGIVAWDMTILGYVASIHYVALEPRTFLYPLGSGSLGFAWPGALGAKAAKPETTVVAVVGDGGFMYGLSELASARQHGLAAKLLLINDGGYGVLREYQRESFDAFHGVDLKQPDFEAMINAFGVPVRVTTGDRFEADLGWALNTDGPAAVILRERLVYATPTE